MAGLPWLELHVDLPRHPKSVKLALVLREPDAWLRMVRVWMWLAEHHPAGLIEDPFADQMVAIAAGWKKTPADFSAAITQAGFAERTESGGLFFRSWAKRAAAHVGRRERDALRQKKRYERVADRFKPKPEKTPESAPMAETSRGEDAETARRPPGETSDSHRNSNPNTNPNPDRNTNPNRNPNHHPPSEEVDTLPRADAPGAPGDVQAGPGDLFPEAVRPAPPVPAPPPVTAPRAHAARARKDAASKSTKPPPDERHTPLVAAMDAAYRDLLPGEKWDMAGSMGGREGKAVKALLAKADADPATAGDAAPAEVLRRWRNALADPFSRVRYAHVLVNTWGKYATGRASGRPQTAGGRPAPSVRRGTVRAEDINHSPVVGDVEFPSN